MSQQSAQGWGRILLAERGHADGSVELRQFAIGPNFQQQSVVAICWLGQSEALLEGHLGRGRRRNIATAHDARDANGGIIDDTRELIRHRSVTSPHHRITSRSRRFLTQIFAAVVAQMDDVIRQPRAQRRVCLTPAARGQRRTACAIVIGPGPIRGAAATGGKLAAAQVTGIQPAIFGESIERGGMSHSLARLVFDRIKIEPKPREVIDQCAAFFRGATRRIKVFDAQYNAPTISPHVQPRQQPSKQGSRMSGPGGRRRKTTNDGHYAPARAIRSRAVHAIRSS